MAQKKVLKKFFRWWDSEQTKAWRRKVPMNIIAGVALYQSYWHIRDSAQEHGVDPSHALILPFSVDGLLIVSSRFITEAKSRLGRFLAITGFVFSMFATLAGNWLAANPDWISRAWHTWPAVALILAGVILHWSDRKPKPKRVTKEKKRRENVDPLRPLPETSLQRG